MENYKNEQIDLNVTQQPGCRVRFDITISPAECQKARHEAIKQVQKQVSLPGFRKGKSPAAMIEKKFPEAIDEQWKDLLAHAALRQGAQLSNIYPWNVEQKASATIESLSISEGAKLSLEFEREPSAPSIERDALQPISSSAAPVSEAEIEGRILTFREHHGTFEETKNSISDGDYVRIDAYSLESEPHPQLVKDGRVVMIPGKLPEWLFTLLRGKSAGETFEGMTSADPQAPQQEQEQFKPIRVRIEVLAVERLIPPTDEALCKALGTDSIQQLSERLRVHMQREIDGRADQERRSKLWDQLLRDYPFDLPTSMLAREKQRIIRVMVNKLRETESESAIIGQEREIGRAASAEAEGSLRKFFLARKILQDANLEVTEHEIVTRAVQLMIQNQVETSAKGKEREQMWQFYRNDAFYQLLIRKAEDHLLGMSSEAEST